MEGRTHIPVIEDVLCGPCGLCTGACPAQVLKDLRSEDGTLRGRLAQPERHSAETGVPPCREACPLGQDIPGYIRCLGHGDQSGALELILRDNPLPAVLGHICHHPCQEACALASVERPPLLRELKRFAALASRPRVTPPSVRSMLEVAIVGSGPAGLAAAWYLARSGVGVTIYESKPVAGGLPAWAIPFFRLPRKALEEDLGYILSLGIELRLNSKILPSQLNQLRQKNDAVILACGAPLAARLDLPGVDLDGVWLGLDFLYRAALGPAPRPQGPVVVVGGGNVAIDAARWVVRGSRSVTLVCRETRQDMPAYTEEVTAAEKEGVKMFFSAQPTAFKAGKDGLLAEVHFEKALLKGTGPDGRPLFVPVRGEEMVLPANTCIVAVGQEGEGAAWGEALGLGPLKPDQDGRVGPGVYVAGDLATGTETVVQAMAGGITCARAILEEGSI